MTAKWRTKTGCLTCRKRRKKCDENRGVCVACVRNGIECVWPTKEATSVVRRRKLKETITLQSQSLEVSYTDLTLVGTSPGSGNAPSPDWLPRFSNFLDDAILPTTIEVASPSIYDFDDLGTYAQNSPFKLRIWDSAEMDLPYRQELFNYFTGAMSSFLIRHDTHPGFNDWSYTISQGLQNPCLMDILLACSAVLLTQTRPEMLSIAFQYYSSAISGTRARIESGTVDGSEDWILMMVCYLAIFERMQPQSTSNVAPHLQGAVYLMSLKRAKVGPSGLPSITSSQRLYAESVIYNTSFTAYLSPDISWLSDVNVWHQVDVFCTALPYPDASESSNSPLLGVPVNICYLILQISCLARRLPWSIADFITAIKLRNELDDWLGADPDQYTQGELDDLSWRSARLFLLAADILLFKVMDSDVTAAHPRIQRRVQQSLNLLRYNKLFGTYWGQHFLWPIAILACAVENHEGFLYLQEVLELMWTESSFGDVKRTANILKAMEANFDGRDGRQLSLGCVEGEEVQCRIDLLLHKGGLCSLIKK